MAENTLMTTPEAVTNLAESAPDSASICETYATCLRRFLADGAQHDRIEMMGLARQIAAQWTPLRETVQLLWRTARPFLGGAGGAGSGPMDTVLEIERELCEAFEHATLLERRSHMRLASAYSQKIRETDALLNSLPAYVISKDVTSRYVSANRPFLEALGRSAGEVIGRRDADLFRDEEAGLLLDQDREVMGTLAAVRNEITLCFQEEDRRVLLVEAPVFDEKGMVSGLIGVGFDITEIQRIEQDRLLMAAALESAGEAVFITGVDGDIQYTNPAFGTVTGYSPEEAIGQNPRILKSGCQDPQLYQQMWATLTAGSIWRGTITNRKKDGSLFDVDQTIAPIRDSDGRTTSYVAVARDITERNRMVAAMERAMMVKGEFTSMVSHELRTPLTAIKEAIDIVEDETAGPTTKDQAEFLRLAKRNVDRLHRLINDVLDFSKLERGEFGLQPGLHDLNALTREIVTQQQLAAEGQGLHLELSVDDEIGLVPMDADRISQVLVNLVGNAIRYGRRGRIEVSTRRRKGEAIVKIQDSGPGIPVGELERIFDAFVQLSTGPGRQVGGTGLGLAICKQIIELHGGRIWVETEIGRGSAFYFSLRLKAGKRGSESQREAKESIFGENQGPRG
jgi:PAS domain S-box-containing protein